ncbi:MAG: hypothetical protein ACLSHU_13175 [Oscillospiraceae bacterium]
MQKINNCSNIQTGKSQYGTGQFSIPEAGLWGMPVNQHPLSTPQIEAAQNIRAGVARLLQLAKGPQLVDRFSPI